MVDRVILAIRKQIRPRDIRCRQGCIFWQVGVDEPADHGVIVPALQIVEAGFDVLVVAAVAQGVDACEGAVVVRDLAAGVYRGGGFAPGVVAVGRDGFIILRDLRQLLQLVIGILLRILRRDAGRIGRNAACAVVGIIVIGPGQALAPVGGILQPGDLRTGPARGEILELTTLAQSTCTNHPPQMSLVLHSAWRHSHPHFR